MKYQKITKHILFKFMCEIDADIMNPGFPISIPNISELLHTSKYQVRKYMLELREEGLVKSECIYYDGNPSYETGELYDDPRLIRGWNLTDEGRKTITYIEAQQKIEKIIDKIWNLSD